MYTIEQKRGKKAKTLRLITIVLLFFALTFIFGISLSSRHSQEASGFNAGGGGVQAASSNALFTLDGEINTHLLETQGEFSDFVGQYVQLFEQVGTVPANMVTPAPTQESLTASFTHRQWRAVAYTDGILTLWMTQPYRNSRFGSNINFSTSTARSVLDTDLNAVLNHFPQFREEIITFPSAIPWHAGQPTLETYVNPSLPYEARAWLPSWYELRMAWNLNATQRGHTVSHSLSNSSWLRSSFVDLFQHGSVQNNGLQSAAPPSTFSLGIRPAIHIDTNELTQSATVNTHITGNYGTGAGRQAVAANSLSGFSGISPASVAPLSTPESVFPANTYTNYHIDALSGGALFEHSGINPTALTALDSLLSSMTNNPLEDVLTAADFSRHVRRNEGTYNPQQPGAVWMNLFQTTGTTGTAFELSRRWWQPVYLRNGVLTLYMVAPYRNSLGGPTSDHTSTLRTNMLNDFDTMMASFNANFRSELPELIVDPREVPWQTNAAGQNNQPNTISSNGLPYTQLGFGPAGGRRQHVFIPSLYEVRRNVGGSATVSYISGQTLTSGGARHGRWQLNGFDRGFSPQTGITGHWQRSVQNAQPTAGAVTGAAGHSNVISASWFASMTTGVRPAIHLNLEHLIASASVSTHIVGTSGQTAGRQTITATGALSGDMVAPSNDFSTRLRYGSPLTFEFNAGGSVAASHRFNNLTLNSASIVGGTQTLRIDESEAVATNQSFPVTGAGFTPSSLLVSAFWHTAGTEQQTLRVRMEVGNWNPDNNNDLIPPVFSLTANALANLASPTLSVSAEQVLSWPTVSNASHYTLDVSWDNGATWVTQGNIAQSANPEFSVLGLPNLSVGTNLQFRVRAISANPGFGNSLPATITHSIVQGNIPAPNITSVSNAGVVNWSPAGALTPVASWQISVDGFTWHPAGGAAATSYNLLTSTTLEPLVRAALEAGSLNISVRAVRVNSPPHNLLFHDFGLAAMHNISPSALATPVFLTPSQPIEANGIIRWEAVSNVENYQVRVGGGEWVNIATTNVNLATNAALTPFLDFSTEGNTLIEIRAVPSATNILLRPSLIISTTHTVTRLARPIEPSIVDSILHFVPDANADHYLLHISCDDEGALTPIRIDIISAGVNQPIDLTTLGLTGETYEIRLQRIAPEAAGVNGFRRFIDSEIGLTAILDFDAVPLSAPFNLSAIVDNDNRTITLEWAAPLGQSQFVHSYRVFITRGAAQGIVTGVIGTQFVLNASTVPIGMGFNPGTYVFEVQALPVAGSGFSTSPRSNYDGNDMPSYAEATLSAVSLGIVQNLNWANTLLPIRQISFTAVENAVAYAVYVNDVRQPTLIIPQNNTGTIVGSVNLAAFFNQVVDITIRAISIGPNSQWFIDGDRDIANALTIDLQPTQLLPPTSLLAPTVFGVGADARLEWVGSANSSGYFVYALQDGNWQRISGIVLATNFRIGGLVAGNHTLAVRAVHNGQWFSDSELSESIEIEVQQTDNLPAPTGLTRIGDNIGWNEPLAAGVAGYRVYVDGVAVTGVIDAATRIIPMPVEASGIGVFDITVRAIHSDPRRNSSESLPLQIVNSAVLEAPEIIEQSNNVIIWAAVVGATRFEVQLAGGAWQNVGYTLTHAFQSTELELGINYEVRVRAIGNNGLPWYDSAESSTVIVLTEHGFHLNAPFDIRVVGGILNWQWVTAGTAPSRFEIEITNELAGSPFEFTALSGARSIDISNMLAVGENLIRIRAVAPEGNSAVLDSVWAGITFINMAERSPPTGLSLEGNILSWLSDANSFAIYIDGVRRATSGTNSFDLSLLEGYFGEGGNFTVAVRALGDGQVYLDSSLSDGFAIVVDFDEDGEIIIATPDDDDDDDDEPLGFFTFPGWIGMLTFRPLNNFFPWLFYGGILLLLLLIIIIAVVVSKKKKSKVDDGELDECRSKARDAINQAFSELRQAGELVSACELDTSLEQQAMVQLSKTDAAMSHAENCVADFLKAKKLDKKKAK